MIKDNTLFCFCDFETTGLDYDLGKELNDIREQHYPIEIGFVLTDHKFKKITEYSSLIKWPLHMLSEFYDEVKETYTPKRNHLQAQAVHKIPLKEILEHGKAPNVVVQEMLSVLNNYKPRYGRIILISDNIRFEWGFMKKLLGFNVEEIFHYAGWDTSSLLEATEVGDPRGVPHRALEDAKILHEHYVRAYTFVQEAIKLKRKLEGEKELISLD